MRFRVYAAAMAAIVFSSGAAGQIYAPVQIPTMSMPGLGVYIPTVENGGLPAPDERDGYEDREPPKSASRPNTTSLRFTPSQSRRRANLAQFVAKTRAQDKASGDQLAQTFAQVDIFGAVAPVLAKVGLSTNNVADAYTVYWISAWQAANGDTSTPDRYMTQAVKRQVEAGMLATPEVVNASDAQKQELADAYIVQAMLIDSMMEAAGNNPQDKAAVGQAVSQGARGVGLDLSAVKLTRDGFVMRKGADAGDTEAIALPGAEAKPALAANENGGSISTPTAIALGGAGLLGAFFAGRVMNRKG